MKIVRIAWTDSMRTGGWRSAEEAERDFNDPAQLECETVGFLVAQNEDRLMVARDRSDKQVNDTMTIPRSAIRSVKELRG